MTTLFIDSTPLLSGKVETDPSYAPTVKLLSDGSFVTLMNKVVTRWSINNNNNNNDNDKNTGVRHLGKFEGHRRYVVGAVEKDRNTLLTVAQDKTLKEWNINTFQCLSSHKLSSYPQYFVKPRNKLVTICCMENGNVEVRDLGDLSVITSFTLQINPEERRTTNCICELEDGTFVSGSWKILKRRRAEPRSDSTQVFEGHSDWVDDVTELKRDVIVSASVDRTIKIWRVSTGQCLYTLELHTRSIMGLVRLSDDIFVSASWDYTIRVWDSSGRCLDRIKSKHRFNAVTMINEGLITANAIGQFQVWRLK